MATSLLQPLGSNFNNFNPGSNLIETSNAPLPTIQ